MADIDDGGAAFPCPPDKNHDVGDDGLSKRDYFAAQALAGMCSGDVWPRGDDADEMARRAYLFADAMLKARAPLDPVKGPDHGRD